MVIRVIHKTYCIPLGLVILLFCFPLFILVLYQQWNELSRYTKQPPVFTSKPNPTRSDGLLCPCLPRIWAINFCKCEILCKFCITSPNLKLNNLTGGGWITATPNFYYMYSVFEDQALIVGWNFNLQSTGHKFGSLVLSDTSCMTQ